MNINNPCEVHDLVGFKYKHEMLNTTFSNLRRDAKTRLIAKPKQLINKLLGINLRNKIKRLRHEQPHSHDRKPRTRNFCHNATETKRKGHQPVPLKHTVSNQMLERNNHHMTLRINTLRMRLNPSVVTQGKVHQTALIRSHRRKTYRSLLADSTAGSTLGHLDNLIMATALVALDINHNREAEAELAAHQQREHRLERLERTTMATNQHRKIGSSHIKNDLTVVTLVLVDGRVSGIKMSEQLAKDRYGKINDRIGLLVAKLFASLILNRKLGIRAYKLRLNGSNLDRLVRRGDGILSHLNFFNQLGHMHLTIVRYLITSQTPSTTDRVRQHGTGIGKTTAV